MKTSKLLFFSALLFIAVAANAKLSNGDYYIYNDFFQKLLMDNNGPNLAAYDENDDDNFIFTSESADGDYVKLRHKKSGKYLAASTSNTWSILLSDDGAGDEYLWKLDQRFSTPIVSKKNTGKRMGCDFVSGSTYYWNEAYVPVYYDKGVGTMTWFSIIPSNGGGFEASRKATKTSTFTNEYGVTEEDAYCVTENVTVQGVDYHVISSNPFDGGTVNLKGTDSWLILENVRPSRVDLSNVKINGSPAVDGQNCRVEIYIKGAAVIPTPNYAFQGSTDKGSYTLQLGNNKELGDNDNKTRSFTLKRGYMATVYSGKNNTGYSRVYVADHADLTVTLPNALDKRLSSVYIRNWHYTSKSGYGSTKGDVLTATVNCGASWAWNWDANRSSNADVEYVPIKQHLYWPGDGEFYKSGSTAMMLFNEPEHSEQHTSSKCSCGGTIDAWKAYQNTGKFNATGLRLGSPSATDLSYIKQYDDYCHNNGQRMDFNCTHGYWTSEWGGNLDKLKGYGKPIWITEWEYGASWTSGSNPKSADDARAKVFDILERLEYNDYVERYAYYEFDTGGSNGWMREMFWEQNPSKGLAYVGQVYDRVKHHLGYKASIQPVPNWWAPTFAAPSINKVFLSDGKMTISVKNENGDATASISVQKKNGSSWETIAEITDRAKLEDTTLGFDVDADKLAESCSLRAVVTSIYASGTKESAEYQYEAKNVSGNPLDDIKNLSLNEGVLQTANVITYAKDKKGTDLSGEQPVEGWTMNDPGGDAHAAGLIAWGAGNTIGGSNPPAKNSAGTTEGAALGILACWTSTTQYTQDVILPAGTYTITVPVYNATGTSAFVKNLIGFISDNGVEQLATRTSYPTGWTTETITFTLSGMTSGRLSLGYEAADAGSSGMPHLFIDGMTISNGTDTWPKAPVFYTIKFLDEEGNEIASEQYKEGAEVTAPTAPEKEGYTFTGWNEEVGPAMADATYTPLYTINSYTLVYELDGEAYQTLTLEYGAEITPLETPEEREGYTFSGWVDEPEKMPAEDTIIKGTFTANSYNLIYLLDEAEYQTFTVEYGSPITPLESPTKEGYEFSGWSEIPETMPAQDVTITGTFTYIVPDAIAHLFTGAKPVAIFTPEGTRIPTPRKGLNLFRLSDGTIKKVFVK